MTSPDENISPGAFHPFEVSAYHLVYVGLGLFIVIFGMLSLFIKERLYLGEAPIAAVFGIIVGPAALGLFQPQNWGGHPSELPGGHITDEISLEIFRVTIALSVFAVGVELPKKYLLRHWRSLLFLLGPVMIYGWLITASLMYALIPGLDFLNSLVVASCVTPTDPILAQAVVGGPWAEKHVPAHLRHMLMCESGCNDGAAFPFLYLALFLTTNRDNHGKAMAEWFYDAIAYQIIFGTILGALIGWAARKLMRFSERHKLVDRESFVAQYVSLAIASMGVNVLLGSDDLLAAFACGSAFAWDGWFTKQTEDSNFSSIVDLLFNVAVFIYIGALMPYRAWAGGSETEPNTLSIWRLFVLAICVLLVKRIPIVMALWRWIPDIKTFREAVFAGHFGPIGVGAVFIATLARTQLPEEIPNPPETSNDILALTVQPVIYFFVLCSIAVHGLTIPFFAFSKGASKLTRTISRNPSFGIDREPTWVARLRRTKTGESSSPKEVEEGGMTEIERVLNAQLRQIGRGAIGGDAEKEMDRTDSGQETGQSSETAAVRSAGDEGRTTSTPGNHEYDGDDCPESVVGLDDDWDGEDTAEARRLREKLNEQKKKDYDEMRARQDGHDAEKSKESSDHEDGDMGMCDMLDEERGAMDRDIPHTADEPGSPSRSRRPSHHRQKSSKDAGAFAAAAIFGPKDSDNEDERQEREHAAMRKKSSDDEWPRSRSWIEGSKIVIEYQKGPSSDVECQVIPIMEGERDEIAKSDQPAHAWAMRHASAIETHVGLQGVDGWHPSEALNNLVYHRIPTLYDEYLKSGRRMPRRESAVETHQARNERSSMMFNAMAWASQHRNEDDDQEGQARSREDKPRRGDAGKSKVQSRLQTPSPPESPVKGWLAPRPADLRRSGRRSSVAPRQRSLSPLDDGSRQPAARLCKEHKLSSDARRRNTTRRALAGRVNFGSRREEREEVVDSPEGRGSGLDFPRSMSAGGLGIDRFDRDTGRTGMTPSSSSNRLTPGSIGMPRTKSTSDDQSSTFSGRERIGGGGGVQWVDELDHTHDRDSRSTPVINRQRHGPSSRSTLGRMLEREFSAPSLADRGGSEAERGGESDVASGSEDEATHGRNKRKSRIATFFSSFASPRTNRDASLQEEKEDDSHDTLGQVSSRQTDDRFPRVPSMRQPQSLQSTVPTFITGMGSGPEGGGILSTSQYGNANNNNDAASGNSDVTSPQRTATSPGQLMSGGQDQDRDRGVTFDLT